MILQPVLMRIPRQDRLTGPQRLERQRRFARAALQKCAVLCNAPTDGWRQSDERIPIPNGGFHWSISHKRSWAAAVIADRPVGIDIEFVAPRKIDLFDEAATTEEWSMVGGRSWPAFFRIWTAKEATLKANSVGIGHLAACRIIAADAPKRMTTCFAGRECVIEHFEHDGHIAAVTSVGDKISWHVAEEAT